jgi:16S rRNA (adenine1518-N6/adenine1519-N6)-dimethyltransferase
MQLTATQIYQRYRCCIAKKFGQNFLFDEKINRKIVSIAGDLSDKVVVEVGPGPGGLTLEILKQPIQKVHVVEIDPHWCNVWRSLKELFDDKLHVIEQDALKFDFRSISPNIIISNLPYNISVPLLFRWIRDFDGYENLVLMFQKEVADRLTAKPSTKSYGKLSVLAQHAVRIEKVFDVEPGSFFPRPKVRSTVVKISARTGQAPMSDSFVALLSRAFAHRRKAVAKALAGLIEDPVSALIELGYDEHTRAEEISVDDYAKLHSRVISQIQ